MQPLLVVDGLKKTYPNFKLNEVSFAVYEDCITGFIGANGAGKTTTIRSILNLISCEAGSIKFKGKDTKKTEKAFKDSIGVVFDEKFYLKKKKICCWKVTVLLKAKGSFLPKQKKCS